MLKETRILNVNYNKSGSGSVSTRLNLPITFLRELGVTEIDRSVEVTLKGDEIIIKKAKKE
ncbi:AbrB/MazE/SpoVT family DNA-binding domain-containing protein [Clostridioides sp. ZZV13-5731]|uniref:AbrB/MazE/SpoVT family DNA-binding domain-containing protein n=1 Tax=unclassified Clostridioides TaxID=2635829 RepID=UPI001D11DDCC|nr:AbrB/MazE/SpoVT family DNA-binding domain-containing protein [Clostridioides sp. ZZV14-6044]MCC0752644.1 AbrB/MazE/SpoVT family DNA-binding domain-containing protein [Clostridioides sp. ZZV13-5731]